MNCDELNRYLDDWLDGELPSAERARFEAHLDACADCRESVRSVRELLAGAAALRHEQQPPHDLWPAIAAGIRQPASTSGNRDWLRAIAASIFVVGVFFAGMLADRVMEDAETPEQLATIDRIPAGAERAAARRILPQAQVELVSGIRNASNAQTEDVLLRNLLIINLAIREMEEAVGNEPDNPQLRDLLASLYEQENRLLRRAERMTSEGNMKKRVGI